MKATALAPANIAFIKYWGKADPPTGEAGDALRLPLNSSISMNLSACTTTTTVEFSDRYKEDSIESTDGEFLQKEVNRVTKHLDRLRERAQTNQRAKVLTKNSFPKSAGVASSASGFAALTVAGAKALDLALSDNDLTILARLGSGSACRSIPDGFVMWHRGKSSQTSYAYSLYPYDYWDLRDVLVVVEASNKKISTTEGMEKVRTSPFWNRRLRDMPDKIKTMKKALATKNFRLLGEIIEAEAVNMHAVMMTQRPPLFYWNGATMELIRAVQLWRAEGLPVYFTIDAGPNVHLICEVKDEDTVVQKVKNLSVLEQVIVNQPSRGAHVVQNHLF